MVTYNGETTNLTGEGSPNPVKLTLPSLDQVQDPAVAACLLRIQQFVNNLIAPTSGGGGYASLTGAGETTTPGALTQDGDFTISNTAVVGTFVSTVQTSPTSFSQIDQTLGQISITCHSSTVSSFILMIDNQMQIQCGNINIFLDALHGQLSFDTYTGSGYLPIRFYDAATGASRQTITGSRGGNTALASLITALSTLNLGLIIDSTTP